jgi:hypothetical protein
VRDTVESAFGGIAMINQETGDWRRIAEQASAEINPAKMLILVHQLCRELDREDQKEPTIAYRV